MEGLAVLFVILLVVVFYPSLTAIIACEIMYTSSWKELLVLITISAGIVLSPF